MEARNMSRIGRIEIIYTDDFFGHFFGEKGINFDIFLIRSATLYYLLYFAT